MCDSAMTLATQLYAGIALTGGATVTLVQCEHGGASLKVAYGAQPEGGYMVALDSEPMATCALEAWTPMSAYAAIQLITESQMLSQFLLSNPFAGVGFWVDPSTNVLVLDAVEMYQDRTVALTLAAARGQKAIYDLALGQDVLVR